MAKFIDNHPFVSLYTFIAFLVFVYHMVALLVGH